MPKTEQEKESYMKWDFLAKDLSECSDIMPKTLPEHQERVYNACLDMAYRLESKYRQGLQEIIKEVEGMKDKRRYSIEEYVSEQKGHNSAIEAITTLLKERLE